MPAYAIVLKLLVFHNLLCCSLIILRHIFKKCGATKLRLQALKLLQVYMN